LSNRICHFEAGITICMYFFINKNHNYSIQDLVTLKTPHFSLRIYSAGIELKFFPTNSKCIVN